MSKKFDINKSQNILIPRFDTFGDIVLLQGFIKALIELRPKARVVMLVRKGYEQLAEVFPDRLIWKTTKIDPYDKAPDIKKTRSFLDMLATDAFDLVLITTFNRTYIDDIVAAKFSSAWRITICNSLNISNDLVKIPKQLGLGCPSILYDEFVLVEEKSHETEKYQTLWENLTGKKDLLPLPQLLISNKTNKNAQDALAVMGLTEGNFYFCFPAGIANVSRKVWPEEKFAELIADIEKKHNLKALVVGHKTERTIIEKVVSLAKQKGANPKIWLGQGGEIT